MVESLKSWDESLFIYLNGFHTDFLDPIVFQLTQTIPWIPLYLFLTFLVVKKFGKQSWWVFISIGLTILIADQFTSGFMKPFFERLRPCHDPRWEGIVHNFGKCGGLYGFASSHASNSFGIATIMALTLTDRFQAVKWLFLWAALFSYTRIYLGVHYPADVIVGASVGTIGAYLSYQIGLFLNSKISAKTVQS
ncbi:phosphatase PAP2 family protein [Belliella sp. R4-6]|uniref:Phosphatase PAP2 family protein n=1 Tax=Belliella alkalica TaxID=1730871 RepID=A0ABS9V729_9BACT|nr:phosphatase PAP2 family protein [Belliella alkalica]MCH7412233.1 phosphatase PAP2 family protein [Belliella alkalica]